MDIVIDMWSGDDEGALSKWFAGDGDTVREGDMIATVAFEKTEFEILAPKSGKLERLVSEDCVVKSGDPIGRIL